MTNDPSDAPYEIHETQYVRIPMPDGIRLSAALVLPDAPGPFPALFDYYPYRKDDLSAGRIRLHQYLARHGYAALRLDVRGTGSSEGYAEDEYVLQEQLDGVAAIQWMSEQPWCSGAVGMFGTSYGGFNALQVAMHRPPALKAICPMYFTDNRYVDECHYKGGALSGLYDLGSYGLSMVAENALPPDPERVGEQWAKLYEERLGHEPWLLNWLENQVYNDYWKHGSLCEDYGAIQCTSFLIGGWRDGYVNCNLRTFQHLECPKKLLIGPWLHALPDVASPGPCVDHLHEMVRFFDYWLKGEPNGVMDEPPITLYVQQYDPPRADRQHTSGFWRYEPGWPLERADLTPLYLAAGGRLEPSTPPQYLREQYVYNPTGGTTFGMFSAGSPYLLPVDQRLEDSYALNWTSEPLLEPLEILGRPEAVLHLAVNAEIATVVARLMDVAPDGTAALICKGVLNLTHRESHAQPSPLVPGQEYEIRLPLDATSWLFEPGHRVRLGLSGADFPNTWPSPLPYTAELSHGSVHPSRLVLPVVGPQQPPLREPRLRPPAPFEPLVSSHSDREIWQVTRDHLEGRVEMFMRTGGHTRVNDRVSVSSSHETTASVYEQDPARATTHSLTCITLHWPARTIDTRARGQLESTANTFNVTVQLEVTMDGRPYFSRRWVRSIPRHLL